MSVDTEREGGVRVAELIRHPPDALPRLEGMGRPSVACTVELERKHTFRLSPPPQPVPRPAQVAPV